MKYYTGQFYDRIRERSLLSAKEIVPMVLKLVKPASVIDLGCGEGIWLSVFRDSGVEDIRGVDGAWIDKKRLNIPEERFVEFDLKDPYRTDRRFDLVVSLEVAEHLPVESAETLIESLTGLGPVILFSASIPFSEGEQHLNEQWQDYWVCLFRERGYEVIDCLRKKIWNIENVEYWYAQNMFLFVKKDYLEENDLLRREYEKTDNSQLSIVHPVRYLEVVESKDPENITVRRAFITLLLTVRNSIKRRIEKLLHIGT
ncbi:class I SAM-dependent methyltransferase [Candidatus Auribacterota bacterium]